jgi:hypothetical protein
MNSLKHGRRSRRQAQAREDSLAFEHRLCKWMAANNAHNDVEEFLTYRSVSLSVELEQLDLARQERRMTLLEQQDEAEVRRLDELAALLFYDPAGRFYGIREFDFPTKKTSGSGLVDDKDPAVILSRIEASALGCNWLLQQFEALLERLQTAGFLQAQDKFKLVRLLGCQPTQILEDSRVAAIFVACEALNERRSCPFFDLLSDLEPDELARISLEVRRRWPDLSGSKEDPEWKQMLVNLLEENIERLRELIRIHEANTESDAQRAYDRSAFDSSDEGEAMRAHMIRCTDRLNRGLAALQKYQAGKERNRREREHRDWHEPSPSPYRSEFRARGTSGYQDGRDGHAAGPVEWNEQPESASADVSGENLRECAGAVVDDISSDKTADSPDWTATRANLSTGDSLAEAPDDNPYPTGETDSSYMEPAVEAAETHDHEITSREEISGNLTSEAIFSDPQNVTQVSELKGNNGEAARLDKLGNQPPQIQPPGAETDCLSRSESHHDHVPGLAGVEVAKLASISSVGPGPGASSCGLRPSEPLSASSAEEPIEHDSLPPGKLGERASPELTAPSADAPRSTIENANGLITAS